MRVYIEAYNKDGKQILGNLDGQCLIRCKDYKLSSNYRHAVRVVKEGASLNGAVHSMRVVDAKGNLLETISK
jgi:hypothetical protein